MITDAPPTQEPEARSLTVGIAVTPAEKDAIEIVVKVRRPEGGASGLLRRRPFSEVVEEGRRMLDRLVEETESHSTP